MFFSENSRTRLKFRQFSIIFRQIIFTKVELFQRFTQCGKCLNSEFFSGLYFTKLDRKRRFTPQVSEFSPNAGKYVPEETPNTDNFHAVLLTPGHKTHIKYT